MNSVRQKGYAQEQVETYFTKYFPVSKTWKEEKSMKVVDEIRMVYDTTKSGLNDTVWTPWFTLQTIEAELRLIDSGTYMADCDAVFFSELYVVSLY